ncbi:hypothetical protein [Magnetospirillum sp. SS-4]|uniref:hypothetical protein n=1 Tax=Magnetospirillum sp. SS-4 TaxID=2681465 RepID=UPI00137EFCE8|nr:hypothetical protein [Magnetospirillum sp. SS-4]CAA7622061.1 conserved hypothetical protein [Magnetospirillum sp. SS-4]
MAMSQEAVLAALVLRVVAEARRAGLDPQEQRDAARAVLMAALPFEVPAIAHNLVDLVFPRAAAAGMAA